MSKSLHDEDARLSAAFKRELPPIADEGFTKSIVWRVRKRKWLRRIVLSAATGVGLLLALLPARNAVLPLANELTLLARDLENPDTLGKYRVLLELFPAQEAMAVVSDKLMFFATHWNDPSWVAQYQIFLLAGLLALLSPLAIRLLEH